MKPRKNPINERRDDQLNDSAVRLADGGGGGSTLKRCTVESDGFSLQNTARKAKKNEGIGGSMGHNGSEKHI